MVEFVGEVKFRGVGSGDAVAFWVNVAFGHNTVALDEFAGFEGFRAVEMITDVVFWIHVALPSECDELVVSIVVRCKELVGRNDVTALIVDDELEFRNEEVPFCPEED